MVRLTLPPRSRQGWRGKYRARNQSADGNSSDVGAWDQPVRKRFLTATKVNAIPFFQVISLFPHRRCLTMQAGMELETKIRINRNRIESTIKSSCQTGKRSWYARGSHNSGEIGWNERPHHPNSRRRDTVRRTSCLRTMMNQRVPRHFRRWVKLT